jgi:hypothetical protein
MRAAIAIGCGGAAGRRANGGGAGGGAILIPTGVPSLARLQKSRAEFTRILSNGVRPISRARTTRATSKSPRALRSLSNPPIGWSS